MKLPSRGMDINYTMFCEETNAVLQVAERLHYCETRSANQYDQTGDFDSPTSVKLHVSLLANIVS
jgi:hypothetical protein